MEMNLSEFLEHVFSSGQSDYELGDIANVSYVAIYRIRLGKTKRPHPSTLRALADAFDFELKMESGEPHFYPRKNTEIDSPPRGDPSTVDDALKIKAYLDELGIANVEELKQVFMDAGAVFGRKESEVTEVLQDLRALDAIRKLARDKKIKG